MNRPHKKHPASSIWNAHHPSLSGADPGPSLKAQLKRCFFCKALWNCTSWVLIIIPAPGSIRIFPITSCSSQGLGTSAAQQQASQSSKESHLHEIHGVCFQCQMQLVFKWILGFQEHSPKALTGDCLSDDFGSAHQGPLSLLSAHSWNNLTPIPTCSAHMDKGTKSMLLHEHLPK